MAYHASVIYRHGDISIGPPALEYIQHAAAAIDVADSVQYWFNRARADDAVYYFTIYRARVPVGQIFLHDIDWQSSESLIGYHLFEPELRGQGIGTAALGLLKNFVREQTQLLELVIITSIDNLASQRVAEKCGFLPTGGAREDPVNLVVYTWRLER